MGKVIIDAKEALAELSSLVVKMKEVRSEITSIKNNSKGSYDDMTKSMKDLENTSASLSSRMQYLRNIIAKQAKEQSNVAKETNKATKATKKNNKALKDSSNAAEKTTRSNKKLSLSLKDLIKGFGLIAGIQFLKDIALQTFEQIKTFDSLRYSLQLLNETVMDYNNANRFLLELTKDYGVELISTTNRWIKFSAAAKNAGLSVRETENIFRSMTKAGASLGLKTDELVGIYLALEQMLSKGKVTTEELRRQLGERLPGAMGIMAGAIGVTLPKLDEMLRKGEVLSADVLPKFADAVEVAYGINTVKKIDNLVSAQNRLLTSWQNFVKGVSEESGFLNKTLTYTFGALSSMMNKVTYIMGGEQAKMQKMISDDQKEVLRTLTLFARNRFGIAENYAKSDLKLNKDLKKLKAKLLVTGGIEERRIIQSEIDKKQKMLIDFDKKIKELEVEVARELFPATIKEFEQATETYNKILKDFKEVESGDKVNAIYSQEDLDEARNNLSKATAAYNTYKKFMEDSKVVLPEDEDDEEVGRQRITRLKKIADLDKQLQNEVLRKDIEKNKALIDSDSTTYAEKIKLLEQNNEKRNMIIRNQAEIEKEAAIRKEEEKIDAIKKAQARGDSFEGVGPETQIDDLRSERASKVAIAEEKMMRELVASNKQGYDDIMKIVDDFNEQYVDSVADKYNLEIIAANKAYENSLKTEQDKKKLSEDLRDIAIRSANAQIDAQIELRRALLQNADLSQDAIAKIILEINELEAAKQKNIKSNKDLTRSDKDMWMEALDIASEYSRSIGALVDNLHARKIENINAEIEAERRKYDKLIMLAEGDVEQQKTLRRNRDDAIRALEKKRLKEEQKQAKARKAFAIAEIVINTAVAISKVLGQAGIFGIPLVPVVAALGAVQIAAVIAQPIPKYKDGGVSPKDEPAMINDGGKQEYVKRGNEILTTKNKNAIVNLKKDDIIYKDYDDMINKELLAPNNINEIGPSESKFNSLFFGITSSIDEGFKKAKIKNIVNVVNKEDNKDYREKLSRW